MKDKEQRPLLGPIRSRSSSKTDHQLYKVYKRRWYVLALFVLTSCTQSMTWNTWGPITDSAEEVFGWSDSTIGLIVNLGNISFVTFVMLMSWINDEKGLRVSMLISTTCLVIGAGLRCITLEPTPLTWFACINSVCNGICGSVAFAAPALMSNTWFPPNQRATATAIGTFFVFMGVGMSFILGPQVVRSPKYEAVLYNITTEQCHEYGPTQRRYPAFVVHTNPNAWLVVIANSLPIGIIGVWGPVLDVNMKPLGISQNDAGWKGFWLTFGGCASGLILARFNDLFKRRMKLFLILLLLGGIISSLWFTLLCSKYISFNLASLYAASVLAGIFINATIPLFFELSCEAGYPVAEGLIGGFLTFFQNLVGIFFLLLLFIPSLGNAWMNWALVASCVLALPLVCMFPEEYKRTNIDTRPTVDVDVTIDVKINSDTNIQPSEDGNFDSDNCHKNQENIEKSYSPYDL